MATTREQIPVVVNRHHFRNKQIPEPSLYVGRGTPLGNPFTVQKHGPGALELYRRHLWQKIRGRDVAVLAAMGAITAKHSLVCSCKPRPCHGDVIVRAWVWMQGTEPNPMSALKTHIEGVTVRADALRFSVCEVYTAAIGEPARFAPPAKATCKRCLESHRTAGSHRLTISPSEVTP